MGDFMKNDRRTFQVYDIEIGSKKDGAILPTMTEAVAVWEHMRVAARTYSINAGDGTMLIGDADIRVQDQLAILLIRLSDKRAPNSVYSDPGAGVFNEHQKDGNLGSDFCCHVIISLAPENGQPNLYTCAIERVSGLTPGLVQRILSKLLNFEYHDNAAFYSYPAPGGGNDKNGNPRRERCCPYVELRARPSQTLIDDINNGTLTGISLIRTEPVTPIAGAPYLLRSKSELRLSIDQNNLPAQIFDSVMQAFQANSGQYAEAKVTYRVPNSTRIVTVELNAATGEPLNPLYVRSFDISPIFPPLAQSSNAIVPRLIEPTVPEFLANRTI